MAANRPQLAAPVVCPQCGYTNPPSREHLDQMAEHGVITCDSCSKTFIPETDGE